VAAGTRVAWIAWQPPTPFEAVLLDSLSARLPPGHLRQLTPDWFALGGHAPLLQAAWPEFVGGLHSDAFDPDPQEDALPKRSLRERRLAWQRQAVGPIPEILHADDREREAQLAAHWVHRRLAADVARGQPPGRIAIVVLDRWLARRVRFFRTGSSKVQGRVSSGRVLRVWSLVGAAERSVRFFRTGSWLESAGKSLVRQSPTSLDLRWSGVCAFS
jgi:hypothetical protein